MQLIFGQRESHVYFQQKSAQKQEFKNTNEFELKKAGGRSIHVEAG